jgi:CheY-like chemotaxis protein
MIRVLLAEDQAMVRGALSALLNLESDIEVLCSVADGEAAWREVQRLKPDVLVTDIEMPGITGLELVQRIHRHELPVKSIIVTTFARPGFLRRALDAGVSGYLLKDAPAEHLAEALRTVHRGGRSIRSWRWRRGRKPIRSMIANGRCCGLPGKGNRPAILPSSSISRMARYAITCPRRSASWARPTGSRRTGWRGRKAGCSKSRLGGTLVRLAG